jgi:DNA helicase-2/ATP-dependent DNA helicase PcrA
MHHLVVRFDNKLVAGNVVMHERFGKGEVLNLEGVGADKKAEIKFEVGGIKKLLLRFEAGYLDST